MNWYKFALLNLKAPESQPLPGVDVNSVLSTIGDKLKAAFQSSATQVQANKSAYYVTGYGRKIDFYVFGNQTKLANAETLASIDISFEWTTMPANQSGKEVTNEDNFNNQAVSAQLSKGTGILINMMQKFFTSINNLPVSITFISLPTSNAAPGKEQRRGNIYDKILQFSGFTIDNSERGVSEYVPLWFKRQSVPDVTHENNTLKNQPPPDPNSQSSLLSLK